MLHLHVFGRNKVQNFTKNCVEGIKNPGCSVISPVFLQKKNAIFRKFNAASIIELFDGKKFEM